MTFGRAAVAGGLSALYLLVQRLRGTGQLPARSQWGLLGFTALGVVVGFPLFLSLALQYVPSTHGAVVTGLLPLATAVVAAIAILVTFALQAAHSSGLDRKSVV